MVFSLCTLIKFKLFFLLQLCFIDNFLLGKVLADDNDIQYYDLQAVKYIDLENSPPARIELKGTLYMKQYKNTKDSILTGFVSQETNIVLRHNEFLNASECKSFDRYGESILQPFVVKFNTDGTFKHILVNKNQQPLVVNLYLYFSPFLQNQIVEPIEKNKNISIETKESITYGTCNVTYKPHRKAVLTVLENVRLKKVYDMESCSGLDDTSIKNKYDYCTSESEENLEWYLKCDSDSYSQRLNSALVLQSMVIDEHVSFKPFKDNPTKMSLRHLISTNKINKPSSEPILEFDEENAKIVDIKGNNLIPVNEAFLSDKNDSKNQEFKEIYRALSCYKADQNIFLDFIEHFLQCNA